MNGTDVDTAECAYRPGEVMHMVADRLTARGYDVRRPETEEGRRLTIRSGIGRCMISVSDCGHVEWEYALPDWGEAAPKRIADVATLLLTGGSEDYPRQGTGYGNPGISLKGVAGLELKARGLDVSLEVYEDDAFYDVLAAIVVTNPGTATDAAVRVCDDGIIIWERDYYAEAPDAPPATIADSIATTLAQAISLSQMAVTG
jgi:hypothetical protein